MSKSSKKKGLSIEEKCERVGRWFDKHPHPYTLKELTSLIPKATGVIWQSVEECVELLVSEGKVMQEKVGIYTLFWRFPLTEAQTARIAAGGGRHGESGAGSSGTTRTGAVAAAARLNLSDRLALLTTEQLDEQRVAQQSLLESIRTRAEAREAEVGPEEDVRADADALQQCHQQRLHLLSQRHRLAAFNPQLLGDVKAATRLAFDAANRWTDNYFLLEEQMTARMGQSATELRALLHIPTDIDFVEWADLAPQRPARDEVSNTNSDPSLLSETSPANPPCAVTAVPHMCSPASPDTGKILAIQQTPCNTTAAGTPTTPSREAEEPATTVHAAPVPPTVADAAAAAAAGRDAVAPASTETVPALAPSAKKRRGKNATAATDNVDDHGPPSRTPLPSCDTATGAAATVAVPAAGEDAASRDAPTMAGEGPQAADPTVTGEPSSTKPAKRSRAPAKEKPLKGKRQKTKGTA